MKAVRLSGPVWIWMTTLLIVGWLARTAWQLQRRNEALRAEAAPPVAAVAEAATATSAPTDDAPTPGLSAEEMRAEAAREKAAQAAIEAKIAAIEKQLPPKDELLVSFGRIDDMGQRAAKAVQFILTKHQSAPASAPKPLVANTDEVKTFFTDFLGQLSELRGLEDEPREIARFQATTLRELFGLDEATTQRATTLLESEFAQLKTQGLHAAGRPAANPAEWDRRRDAAITALAAKLQPILPANHKMLPLAPGILSLGGGLRTEVKMNADGRGSVNMTLPLFPSVKGL